jgi:hypothetical protein
VRTCGHSWRSVMPRLAQCMRHAVVCAQPSGLRLLPRRITPADFRLAAAGAVSYANTMMQHLAHFQVLQAL